MPTNTNSKLVTIKKDEILVEAPMKLLSQEKDSGGEPVLQVASVIGLKLRKFNTKITKFDKLFEVP